MKITKFVILLLLCSVLPALATYSDAWYLEHASGFYTASRTHVIYHEEGNETIDNTIDSSLVYGMDEPWGPQWTPYNYATALGGECATPMFSPLADLVPWIIRWGPFGTNGVVVPGVGVLSPDIGSPIYNEDIDQVESDVMCNYSYENQSLTITRNDTETNCTINIMWTAWYYVTNEPIEGETLTDLQTNSISAESVYAMCANRFDPIGDAAQHMCLSILRGTNGENVCTEDRFPTASPSTSSPGIAIVFNGPTNGIMMPPVNSSKAMELYERCLDQAKWVESLSGKKGVGGKMPPPRISHDNAKWANMSVTDLAIKIYLDLKYGNDPWEVGLSFGNDELTTGEWLKYTMAEAMAKSWYERSSPAQVSPDTGGGGALDAVLNAYTLILGQPYVNPTFQPQTLPPITFPPLGPVYNQPTLPPLWPQLTEQHNINYDNLDPDKENSITYDMVDDSAGESVVMFKMIAHQRTYAPGNAIVDWDDYVIGENSMKIHPGQSRLVAQPWGMDSYNFQWWVSTHGKDDDLTVATTNRWFPKVPPGTGFSWWNAESNKWESAYLGASNLLWAFDGWKPQVDVGGATNWVRKYKPFEEVELYPGSGFFIHNPLNVAIYLDNVGVTSQTTTTNVIPEGWSVVSSANAICGSLSELGFPCDADTVVKRWRGKCEEYLDGWMTYSNYTFLTNVFLLPGEALFVYQGQEQLWVQEGVSNPTNRLGPPPLLTCTNYVLQWTNYITHYSGTNSGTNVTWADPGHWTFYRASSSNGTYALYSTTPGSNYITFVVDDGWYKLRGEAKDGSPETEFSVAVEIGDNPAAGHFEDFFNRDSGVVLLSHPTNGAYGNGLGFATPMSTYCYSPPGEGSAQCISNSYAVAQLYSPLFPPDQSASITIGYYNTYVGPMVRMQPGISSGYLLQAYNANVDPWRTQCFGLYRIQDNGTNFTFSQLGPIITNSHSGGDKLTLCVSGVTNAVLDCYLNDEWFAGYTDNAAARLTCGQPGIWSQVYCCTLTHFQADVDCPSQGESMQGGGLELLFQSFTSQFAEPDPPLPVSQEFLDAITADFLSHTTYE